MDGISPVSNRASTTPAVFHCGASSEDEARKLVLNLLPYNQTTEMAFEEMRAEYRNTESSLDPLAEFYDWSQRPG